MTFRAEVGEHTDTLNRTLMKLEQGAAGVEKKSLHASLLRTAHSLKGAARVMDASEVGRISSAARTTDVEKTTRRRVLVVDDSITTRTLEKNVLLNAGYEVIVAADGAEAWGLVQTEKIDGIVSDVDMPNMNGFELAEHVRSNERYRDLPIVLVTGKERREDRLRGLQAGADAYMTKSSFDQTDPLETLKTLFG